MHIDTATPLVAAQAPPELAAAILAEAVEDAEAARHQARRQGFAAAIRLTGAETRAGGALQAYLEARATAELDPSGEDVTAAEADAESAAFDAACEEPAADLHGIAGKIAIAFDFGMGLHSTPLTRRVAEKIVAGEVAVERDAYAVAHAFLDCLRLADADANLVQLGEDERLVRACADEADRLAMQAREAWQALIPRTPSVCFINGADVQRFPLLNLERSCGYLLGDAWRERLEGERRRLTEKTVTGARDEDALARIDEIVGAMEAWIAVQERPEVVAARAASAEAADYAQQWCEALEAKEDAILAARPTTLRGFAVKAALLRRWVPREGADRPTSRVHDLIADLAGVGGADEAAA